MEHSLAHLSSKSLWPRGGQNHMIRGAWIPLLGWETGRIDLGRQLGREGQMAWGCVQVSTILLAWALRKKKCFHSDPAWTLHFTFIVSSFTHQLPMPTSAHAVSLPGSSPLIQIPLILLSSALFISCRNPSLATPAP